MRKGVAESFERLDVRGGIYADFGEQSIDVVVARAFRRTPQSAPQSARWTAFQQATIVGVGNQEHPRMSDGQCLGWTARRIAVDSVRLARDAARCNGTRVAVGFPPGADQRAEVHCGLCVVRDTNVWRVRFGVTPQHICDGALSGVAVYR